MGFAVDGALGGEAALSRLQSGDEPCVVVTDVIMPDLDGWELVDAMRADPQLAAIPVVMVSGYPEHVARALKAGVRAYLPKPTDPERIAETVALYCHRDTENTPPENETTPLAKPARRKGPLPNLC